MAAVEVLSNLTLPGAWASMTLSNKTNCYMMAVKGNKAAGDTIDPKDIRQVILELGIDSGITEGGIVVPLVIQRVVLNFNNIIAPDNPLNGKVAFVKLFGIPNDLYIRVVSIDDGNKEYKKDAQTTIAINVNAMDLLN